MSTKVLYVIYSHTNPGQVLRLVRALRALSPHAQVAVHHDPSQTPLPPEDIRQAGAIPIPNPVPGEWGDFSCVQQHLHTLRWCADNLEFDWCVTLTGQTYPIRDISGLEERLAGSAHQGYIYHFDPYDEALWPNREAQRRLNYRYFKVPKFRYWHKLPAGWVNKIPKLIKQFNAAQSLFCIFGYPKGLNTRFGIRRWWTPFDTGFKPVGSNINTVVHRVLIEYVFDFLEHNPRYLDFFRSTALPDELFFSSIVCNAPRFSIDKTTFRHIYWPSRGAANVGVMDMSHWDALAASTDYFALKFDQTQAPEILDALDRKLGLASALPPHE